MVRRSGGSGGFDGIISSVASRACSWVSCGVMSEGTTSHICKCLRSRSSMIPHFLIEHRQGPGIGLPIRRPARQGQRLHHEAELPFESVESVVGCHWVPRCGSLAARRTGFRIADPSHWIFPGTGVTTGSGGGRCARGWRERTCSRQSSTWSFVFTRSYRPADVVISGHWADSTSYGKIDNHGARKIF